MDFCNCKLDTPYNPKTLTELVMEQINDHSLPYPKLKVVHGIVRVYDEPDSSSNYTRIPQGTFLIATRTRPSRTSSAIMALVEGDCLDTNGEYHKIKGWVSLNSNHLTII